MSHFDWANVFSLTVVAVRMEQLNDVVTRAKAGDLDAYSRLVQATQVMTYAVALGVLRDPDMAQDATQEAYLRAFRRLADLEEPAAFISWLRRIVNCRFEHASCAADHPATARRRPGCACVG
jgi:hypothetical protein